MQFSGVIPGELRTSTRHTRCVFHLERNEAVDVDKSCWKDFRTPHLMQFSQQNLGTSLKNVSEGQHLSICPSWMGTVTQVRDSRAVCCNALGRGFLRSSVPLIWLDCPLRHLDLKRPGMRRDPPGREQWRTEEDSKVFQHLSPSADGNKGHWLLLSQGKA